MRLPIPVVLMLCAASAAVAFSMGRMISSHRDGGKEEQREHDPRAAVSGLTGKGTAASVGGNAESGKGNGSGLLDEFRRVYGEPFARGRMAKLRKLAGEMDLEALRQAWGEIVFSEIAFFGDAEWEVGDAILRRWLALDPEGAVAFAKALPAKQRIYACWSIASEMAASDPDAALTFARGLDAPDTRAGALRFIVESVAADDIDMAWAIIVRATNEKWSNNPRSLSEAFLDNLSKTDPLRVLGMVSGITDKETVEHSTGRALAHLARDRPDEALRWIAEHASEGFGDAAESRFATSVIKGWAERDPEAAARYASEHPEISPDGSWVRSVARVWSETDFDAALGWIRTLESEALRGQAARGLVSAANLIYDPERLAEFFSAFPDAYSPDMQARFRTIAITWARKDPSGALEWAAQSGLSGQNLDAFRGQLIETWATTEPAEAAMRLGEITDARLSQSVAEKVARALARNDLTQAAAWAAAQEPGPILAGAVEGLAAAYARRDPVEAGAWLEGIPQGAGRDAAVSSYVRALPSDESENAWRWGASIVDPIQRSVALERVAENLLLRDPEAGARQIRESTDLSQEAKWRLLE